jgi:serine/threonine protein kinase
MIGTTVGKYRILGRLGRGGMGIVYKALDETLDREVAIKVLNPDVTDAELLKRFRAEAVSLARLNHPGIATIYELHRHGDDLLMVMEFVRGVTLQSLSERLGPLDPPQAAQICVQILDALAHAHRAGIVHRDLKPANVMVTDDTGTVKIMDFGIARVLGGEHFTHAGFMMGTPAYMAPEQVLGQDVDGRADLYSVGVLFYRLLSRELPFQADTAIAMAQKQVADAPTPLGTFRPNLPPWVDAIIDKALVKTPADRFQTAEAFRAAILAAVTPEAIGELPTMATPVPIGFGSSDETMPVSSAAHLPTRTTASPAGYAVPGATPASMASGATSPTANTPASSAVERTGTTVVLGRGHLITLAAMVVVLLGGIGALTYVALQRGGTTAPALAAPTATETASPVDGIGPADGSVPPPVDPVPESAASSDAALAPAPPRPPSPPPVSTASGNAGVDGAPAGIAKPDPTAAARAASRKPVAPAVVEPPAPETPEVAPVTFDDVKVVVTEGDSMRDRDAVLELTGTHLTVLDRDGTTAILSLPYGTISGAFYSRSRQPKWKGPDGEEVEAAVDRGRLGFFRGERNWLILTTPAGPVFLRFENANLQAALAAVQERTGVTIQR